MSQAYGVSSCRPPRGKELSCEDPRYHLFWQRLSLCRGCVSVCVRLCVLLCVRQAVDALNTPSSDCSSCLTPAWFTFPIKTHYIPFHTNLSVPQKTTFQEKFNLSLQAADSMFADMLIIYTQSKIHFYTITITDTMQN